MQLVDAILSTWRELSGADRVFQDMHDRAVWALGLDEEELARETAALLAEQRREREQAMRRAA